jgi:hypothetical protein
MSSSNQNEEALTKFKYDAEILKKEDEMISFIGKEESI